MQPHAGENKMLRETKSDTNYSKEEKRIHTSQCRTTVLNSYCITSTATELKWDMKRNCCGVTFIYFDHLLPKREMTNW